MSTMQRWTVIGIFEQQDQAKQAMNDLLEAGFSNDQIGFVYRDGVPTVTKSENGGEENAEAFVGGIVGGILGAADALLTPVLGPTVANTIPTTTMPAVEQALERLHLGPGDEQAHVQTGTAVDDAEEDQPEEVTQKLQKPTLEEDQSTEVTEKFVRPTAKGSVATEEPPDEPPKAGDAVVTDGVPTAKDELRAPGQEALATAPTPPADDEPASPAQETSSAVEQKVREEEATGALTGGVVGGVLGAAVALLIPVLGPAFAGGILVTAFSAALGAVAGGLLGAFAGLGIPEEQAHRYEEEFKAGRTIVTVKTDDHQQEALDILYRDGARYANAHDRG